MSHQPSGSGRERLATMRAAEERSARQKKLLAGLAGLVAVVIAIVAVMWAVSNNNDKSSQNASGSGFVKTVETVPGSTFDSVGVGTASNFPKSMSGATALTKDGKPRVIFYGAEFCPYCAMERWSFVAALSRFGTWSGLSSLVSSESNIPTMDFKNAKFTSPYLSLTTYETTDQNHATLQTPSAADQAYFNKYNTSTYLGGSSQNDGAIPFITYGGLYASAGSTYDDSQDMMNASADSVAKALSNTGAASTKGIVGSANVISAQVCKLTKNQPAKVCESSGVKAAAAKLGSQ